MPARERRRQQVSARRLEDDGALGALLQEQVGQNAVLGLGGHGQQVLVDRLGGRGRGRDLDAGGLGHQVGDGADLLLVKGRREQQRLAVGGGEADDLADGGQEAHVEHAIGLVEDEDLDLVEHAGALVDEVDQAAGRGDQDVAAALERALLGVIGDAAHDGDRDVLGARGDLPADVVDLLRELARGGDDQHAGTAADRHRAAAGALDARQGAHGRQQEGRGLARAGLGGGEQVAAGQHLGNSGGLDGGGVLVAEVLDGGEDAVGQAEVGEAGQPCLVGVARGVGQGLVLRCSHAVVPILCAGARGIHSRCAVRKSGISRCARRRAPGARRGRGSSGARCARA